MIFKPRQGSDHGSEILYEHFRTHCLIHKAVMNFPSYEKNSLVVNIRNKSYDIKKTTEIAKIKYTKSAILAVDISAKLLLFDINISNEFDYFSNGTTTEKGLSTFLTISSSITKIIRIAEAWRIIGK